MDGGEAIEQQTEKDVNTELIGGAPRLENICLYNGTRLHIIQQ